MALSRRLLLVISLFSAVSCSLAEADDVRKNCVPGNHSIDNLYPEADPRAPDRFTVSWTTTVSDTPLVVEVVREWSPLGADRFYQLAKDNFYNCATFFRVVPDFVVQFGLAAEPDQNEKWKQLITDDPVKNSNIEGYLTYATSGENTRNTQIFININDNKFLDEKGFSPFARITSGYIDVARQIRNPTPNKSGGVDQEAIKTKGNEWILEHHPKIDMILSTTVTVPGEEDDASPSSPGSDESEDQGNVVVDNSSNEQEEQGSIAEGTDSSSDTPKSQSIRVARDGSSQIAILSTFIFVEFVFGFVVWRRRK